MFRAAFAAFLCVVLLLNPAPARAIGETAFRNPLIANGADPWLQFHNGNYYLATTTWTQQLVMRKSPTISGLATAPAVTIWSDISVLESAGDDPMGSPRHMGRPLGTNWKTYLLWSEFIGSDQSLWIAQMSNPWTVTGPSVVISRPSLSWEIQCLRVNEAPEILQRNGRTFLSYSASYCATPDYKLGMLTLAGSNPMSAASWTKSPNPVFQSANGVYGPGHNGFFTSPDGTQSWLVYHGNAGSSQGCGTTRSTRMQPFGWNADGTPNFGAPMSTNSQWRVEPPSDGSVRFVARHSGKVMDVAGCGLTNGTNIAQWSWLNNNCQRFRLLGV